LDPPDWADVIPGVKILIFGHGSARSRQPLELALAKLGHETFAEEDCVSAAACIELYDLRVVIADGRLPKFGWVELCRQLRSNPAKPYVHVILLEDADSTHEDWAIDAGVDDFLERPADEKELRRRLRPAAYRISAPRTVRALVETA
jgi:sigma-B regulation protein RsbU (phosphoserine phosphatase)